MHFFQFPIFKSIFILEWLTLRRWIASKMWIDENLVSTSRWQWSRLCRRWSDILRWKSSRWRFTERHPFKVFWRESAFHKLRMRRRRWSVVNIKHGSRGSLGPHHRRAHHGPVVHVHGHVLFGHHLVGLLVHLRAHERRPLVLGGVRPRAPGSKRHPWRHLRRSRWWSVLVHHRRGLAFHVVMRGASQLNCSVLRRLLHRVVRRRRVSHSQPFVWWIHLVWREIRVVLHHWRTVRYLLVWRGSSCNVESVNK